MHTPTTPVLLPRPMRARRCRQGSVFVETLMIVPLFVAIWAGALQAFEANVASISARRALRTCAWQHAMSGCEGGGNGCEVGGGGQPEDPPPGLEPALAKLRFRLPFLAPLLTEALPGPAATATTAGAISAGGDFPMMCDPLPSDETTETIYEATCTTVQGYCP